MEANDEIFDPEQSIEQRKDIIESLYQYDGAFEHGVQVAIAELKERLNVVEINIGHYSREKFKGEDTADIDFLEMPDDAFDKYMEYCQEAEWINDQLSALGEMKVLFLFKNLEISMKSLIKRSYEKVNVKNFYK
jgi:hypothetical protein